MRIYLTGFMGSGKTTVGRILAAQLGWDFYDLDQEIEHRMQTGIASIFESVGEIRFREIETDALRTLVQEHVVVATGGGCFIQNQEWMLKHGSVVYLKVPFEVLAKRVGADPSRPLWRNAEKLFHQREAIYERAHFTIDATRSPNDASEEIKKMLNL